LLKIYASSLYFSWPVESMPAATRAREIAAITSSGLKKFLGEATMNSSSMPKVMSALRQESLGLESNDMMLLVLGVGNGVGVVL
jgi:hypothetical protein